ncbi:phytoene/squalene synthase family protein [Streptomyces sp. SCL15-4]|uniref:phytoene/squalene synthase family protein n=1 Tax=Streptomyces sp. SCL15-4 TaxID=2967221 RepID=UPI00296676AA|nr:squalene/phytoene synthase family protein [Streptomyces sp. SCL15-4]
MTVQELDLAGITDSGLRADYIASSQLFRKIGRGRFLGRYMMHPAKRPYFDTFFSFVCYIDDLADDINLSVDVRARRLDEWQRTYLAIAKGEELRSDQPLSLSEQTDAALARALVHTLRTWDLPYLRVPEFVDGHRKALTTYEYANEEELDDFLETVTLLPAIWINQIFEPLSEDAEELCRHTITAFQLLDFIWDVREDLDLGRLYLPLDHLARFNLTRADLDRQIGSGYISDSLRELIQFEIDIARGHLDAGRSWPQTLHPTARIFMETDIQTHDSMFPELIKDDYAFFKSPRRGLDFVSGRMIPRTAKAIVRARKANQQATRAGYRIRPPYRGTEA